MHYGEEKKTRRNRKKVLVHNFKSPQGFPCTGGVPRQGNRSRVVPSLIPSRGAWDSIWLSWVIHLGNSFPAEVPGTDPPPPRQLQKGRGRLSWAGVGDRSRAPSLLLGSHFFHKRGLNQPLTCTLPLARTEIAYGPFLTVKMASISSGRKKLEVSNV